MPSDTSDYENVKEAADTAQESAGATKGLSPRGMKAMQGGDVAAPPPDHQPKSATTELGDARRAETGAERPEVKLHHETAESSGEGRPSEGKPPSPPEGWRPGGPEGGG